MTEGAIIILGSRNDEKGILIPNAIERINKAIKVFHQYPHYKLLPTGGYGAHFNTTNKPHGWYTREYLLSQGIQAENILPIAESKNTIEDAKLSKKIVDELGIKIIFPVTSDYHTARARLIFKKVYGKGYTINVIGTPNFYPFHIKVQRYYHEYRQIIKMYLGIIKI